MAATTRGLSAALPSRAQEKIDFAAMTAIMCWRGCWNSSSFMWPLRHGPGQASPADPVPDRAIGPESMERGGTGTL
jgi:hypothetical protein